MTWDCGVMFIRLEDGWGLAACQCVPCPTIIGTGLVVSNRSLTGSMTLATPGGASAGDLAIVHIVSDPGTLTSIHSGFTQRVVENQSGSYPYGGVGSYIYGKTLVSGDLGATGTWTTSAGNIAGGMIVLPGASAFTIASTKANLGADVPLSHPSVTVNPGNSIIYAAAVGTNLSGGLSFGANTGTEKWNRECTYQVSGLSQKVNQSGTEPVRESSFSRESARVAHTIVVS